MDKLFAGVLVLLISVTLCGCAIGRGLLEADDAQETTAPVPLPSEGPSDASAFRPHS